MFYTSAFDDFPFRHPYGRQSLRYRTRPEAEEAALQHYLWMKRNDEEQEAYAHRRRSREEHAMNERQRKSRLASEDKMRRRWQEEQMTDASDNDDDNNDETGYRILRGQDGQLYYVKIPSRQQHQPLKQNKKWEQQQKQKQDVKGKMVKEILQEFSNDSEDDGMRNEDESSLLGSCDTVVLSPPAQPTLLVKSDVCRNQDSDSSSRAGVDRKKSKRRRAKIVVEDASDSENEDEYKSPWRNRRPSPGQWMEPVEIYNSSSSERMNQAHVKNETSR
mmetsp:Transcript_25242/g.69593  ORF Transcript_25242/g.69593 Transcript_25242/m.69593 type:complete len:275 (+) Transcript_25242:120-944(+)|eukprot:CAMPEP_0172356034 /NCGR_PEP_ID=MMETSP1060-20121228/359_1 /TAXON_ID=37318 /ORGANISM="Pseudo-nitzschia pungens, Strain cf. cingulata" /LENGTH=274 /DNA_ID=CAMNT_0013075913 /DNA_START=97 /DNA_END=921 /DNA_ORIENTATION=-